MNLSGIRNSADVRDHDGKSSRFRGSKLELTVQTMLGFADTFSSTPSPLGIRKSEGANGTFTIMSAPGSEVCGSDPFSGLPVHLSVVTCGCSSEVTFSLPRAARVKLQVYAHSGGKAVDLFDNVAGSGQHQLNFKTGEGEKGMYVFRLTVGRSMQRPRTAVEPLKNLFPTLDL